MLIIEVLVFVSFNIGVPGLEKMWRAAEAQTGGVKYGSLYCRSGPGCDDEEAARTGVSKRSF